MTTTAFNDIRALLLDPSATAQADRQALINQSVQLKSYAVIGMGVLGLATVVSCVAIPYFPLIGILFTVIGALGTVAAHEIMAIVTNAEEMLRSVFNRGVAALSAHAFVTRITANTWVVGPLFGAQIEAGLANP